MKIGLLTYYGDLNCGTNLQAYASLMAIKKFHKDDNVEIIPFHGFYPRILPYISHATPTSLLNDAKRIYKYYKFRKDVLGVTHDKVITNIHNALTYINDLQYDKIYVGADTLLELDRLPHGSEEITAYWLSPHIKAQKILLAASCKNIEYEQLHATQRAKIQASITSFTALGVRDNTTANLLSWFVSDNQVKIIPDPTFSLNIDYSHIENYLQRNNINIPENSICFNTYRTDEWAHETATTLKSKGYNIVSLRPAPWADIVLNGLSPLEQLGVYRYFKLIITHRFHDTIFALKNGIAPLTYIADDSYTTTLGESKCSTLIKQTNLFPEHIIEGKNQLTPKTFVEKSELIINNFDKKKEDIQAQITQWAEEYYNFLRSTINNQ